MTERRKWRIEGEAEVEGQRERGRRHGVGEGG
jgi:hypothetical protein